MPAEPSQMRAYPAGARINTSAIRSGTSLKRSPVGVLPPTSTATSPTAQARPRVLSGRREVRVDGSGCILSITPVGCNTTRRLTLAWMRVGPVLRNAGNPSRQHMFAVARMAEQLGYDSLWATTHTAIPVRFESRYPYDPSGRPGWDATTPWGDALLSLRFAAP